jgi:hypothetical protein
MKDRLKFAPLVLVVLLIVGCLAQGLQAGGFRGRRAARAVAAASGCYGSTPVAGVVSYGSVMTSSCYSSIQAPSCYGSTMEVQAAAPACYGSTQGVAQAPSCYGPAPAASYGMTTTTTVVGQSFSVPLQAGPGCPTCGP